MDLVFVKLGGSLITDKQRSGTVRVQDLQRCANELADGSRGRRFRLVVGHGSGSFGHPAAQRAGLLPGAQGQAQRAGVARTHLEARRLHARVLEALDDAGLCPFSLSASSFLVTEDRRPAQLATEPMERVLELGLVPLLFGDVVMDRVRGAAITSTETLFLEMIRRLKRHGHRVARVVWAGDTDGVLDSDGQPVRTLRPAAAARLARGLTGAAGPDVTGGIRHRLEIAAAMARSGIPSLLVDGRQRDRLRDAVARGRATGSRIAPA
ncbi:MAG: isopentenyl phosphate kinase [Thermoanaerobaculia bacterium]